MPIPGIGVAPSGNLYNELTSVTRRAFVPRLFVQIYFGAPSLFYLWGNAQRAAGGLNQVTIPMQGQSMVQGQYVGYGGGFNAPVPIPGVQNGQFNLSYWLVPVPLPFGENVLQATDTVISLLKARMNDVYAVTRQRFAQDLYTLPSGGLVPNSFLDAFDDGTNAATYGGINRNAAGNSAFKGQYINAGTGTIWNTNYSTAANGFNRKAMSALLTKVTDTAGGEAPTFVVMNPSDHANLNNDFIGVEQGYVMPGRAYTADTPIRSSFPNLNVAGVPIFADHFCPKGQFFGVNVKYSNIYLSEDAAMDFSGFYSLVPVNGLGQQGVVVCGWDFISAKSVSGFQVYGFGGGGY